MGLLNIGKGSLLFVNLHGHSEFSALDGVAQLDDIIEVTAEKGMDAIAITDHGNMSAALPFYLLSRDSQVKPIIGCEVYLDDERADKASRKYYHLVLLVKDLQGYQNLCWITSDAFLRGFYYKPRTTKELLEQHSEGLIALSACLGGEIPQALLEGDTELAGSKLAEYTDIFGDDFYLELQFNEMEEQQQANVELVRLAHSEGVPLVATTDYHYARPEDVAIQDINLGITTHKDNYAFHTRELFIKDGAEMLNAAKRWGGISLAVARKAIAKSVDIAAQCDIVSEMEGFLKIRRFPNFETGKWNKADYLKRLCKHGFKRRLIPKGRKAEYLGQLKHEFDVIVRLGFEEYFLVVHDIVSWAKGEGIFVGAGRGSAAGCMVSWVLGITELDPIWHNLLFERFLNEDRGDHPDIDIDFESARREEVVEYVKQKYGEDCVANISTTAHFGGKGVLRDLGRFFHIPQFVIERVSSQMPGASPSIASLEEEIGDDRTLELMDMLAKGVSAFVDGKVLTGTRLLEIAKKMETQVRNYGTHAAGYVISPEPLTNILPLQVSGSAKTVTTAFDESPRFSCLSKLGLIKIDLLGLKTLDIVKDACQSVQERTGEDLLDEIWCLPLDEPDVLAEAKQGNTVGTFQFESEGIRQCLRDIKPDTFADLSAANALYRPGTIQSGGIETFAKHKESGIEDLDPLLVPALGETYGSIVYQEQVIQLLADLGGFSHTEADTARKVIVKLSSRGDAGLERAVVEKRQTQLEDIFARFQTGAEAKGMGSEEVTELRKKIEQFVEYSFNRAHAASYAYLFYLTLWLKTRYPLDFMRALLRWSTVDDRLQYIREANRLGVKVRPPDVNKSGQDFEREGKAIRYGLGSIKYVKAVGAKIVDVQPFDSIKDFSARVKPTRQVFDSLVNAGALDRFGERWWLKRWFNQYVVGYQDDDLDDLAEEKHKAHLKRNVKRRKTKAEIREELAKKLLDDSKPTRIGLLLAEKQALGYYRRHPLVLPELQEWIQVQDCISSRKFSEEEFGSVVVVLGVVEKREKKHGQHKLMLSDPTGFIRVVMSKQFYAECGEKFDLDDIRVGDIVMASGFKNAEAAIRMKANSELRWQRGKGKGSCKIFVVTEKLNAEL